MSLKAKLEAVIYAAEEPVTLGQLAALFAADALQWKAEQEAASAAETADTDAEAGQPMTNAEFAYLELGQEPLDALQAEPAVVATAVETAVEASAEAGPEPAAVTGPEVASEPEAETVADNAVAESPAAEGQPAPPQDAQEEVSAADAEAELKRQARLRDREVRGIIRQQLDELIASYASDGRGVEIREIAGGFRMATKPECHDAVRLFVKSLKPALRLSLPALETLAVIAYKQPVTAPEVNEIRGVDSSGVFGSLLARKLIATAGRKQVIGRPILYKTTREFLLRFGLKDVSELPSMEEFEKMAASELDEPENGEETAAQTREGQDSTPEFDENSSEDEPVMPAETAANNPAETPAVTAAGPSDATETRVEAEVSGTDRELDPSPADEHAANEPATPADTTPAEASPAAPSPTEQAEIETFSHDR